MTMFPKSVNSGRDLSGGVCCGFSTYILTCCPDVTNGCTSKPTSCKPSEQIHLCWMQLSETFVNCRRPAHDHFRPHNTVRFGFFSRFYRSEIMKGSKVTASSKEIVSGRSQTVSLHC